MKDRVMFRFILMILAMLAISQTWIRVAKATSLPGLPSYTHPTDPAARAKARKRATKVYRAIDAATRDAELRKELQRICRRESACNWMRPVTYHESDARGGRVRWRMAVDRGLLHPETCEAHRLGNPARWTTYGPFGIASAWTVRYVGECAGPESLDDPRVAARAAVAWMRSLCRRHGACDCESRVRWWAGPGIWAQRSSVDQLRSTVRQCGEVPLWRWIHAAIADLPWSTWIAGIA